MRLLADGELGVTALERCRPEATRTNPTTMRKSEDFPAPLRPRIARLSPEATEKFTPAKTSRPPRRQARSVAESRINNAPRRMSRKSGLRFSEKDMRKQ